MSLPESCKRVGCPAPRLHLSVFCEAHHAEQLKPFEPRISPPRPPNHSADVIWHCEKARRNFEAQAIERSEYITQAYDLLIHYAWVHSTDIWEPALNKLDPTLWPEILLFAEQATDQGVMSGGWANEEARKNAFRRARELRQELIVRLRRHLESR